MGALEDRVKAIILDRYEHISTFAKQLDTPNSTVYNALNNSLLNASFSTTMSILAELDMDPDALFHKQAAMKTRRGDYVQVPLHGSISAGQPAEALEIKESFPIPAELHLAYPHAFMLEIHGDSMDLILPNGCLALVDPCSDVDYPKHPYAVAVGNDEATVKLVRILNNGVELSPCTHDITYRPRVYDYGNPATQPVSIIGRVVWYTAPLDWHYSS